MTMKVESVGVSNYTVHVFGTAMSSLITYWNALPLHCLTGAGIMAGGQDER